MPEQSNIERSTGLSLDQLIEQSGADDLTARAIFAHPDQVTPEVAVGGALEMARHQAAGATGTNPTGSGVIYAPDGTNVTGLNAADMTGSPYEPVGTNYGEELRGELDDRFGLVNRDVMTQDEIYQDELDRIQDQLNSINQMYDIRVDEAMRQGEGRLGRTTALNTASGTRFSPRGAAQTSATEAANQRVIDAINAEKAAAIADLYASARGESTRRFESQEARMIDLANSYVNYLADSYNLSFEEANALRDEALSRASLTGYLEGDPTLALRQFLADEEERLVQHDFTREGLDIERTGVENLERERAFRRGLASDQFAFDQEITRAELEIAQETARRNGRELVQGQDGTLLEYDRDTRQIRVLGKYAKPVSGASSTAGGDDTGDGLIAVLGEDAAQRIAAGEDPQSVAADMVADYGSSIASDVMATVTLPEGTVIDYEGIGGTSDIYGDGREYVEGVDQGLQDQLIDRGFGSEFIEDLAPNTGLWHNFWR